MSTTRIDDQLTMEMDDVKEIRIKIDPKNKKLSYRKQTQLICRHKHWGKIKIDMINYVEGEDE